METTSYNMGFAKSRPAAHGGPAARRPEGPAARGPRPATAQRPAARDDPVAQSTMVQWLADP